MATRTALSANYVDVNSVVQASVNGDTVIIPAGSAVWINTLYIAAGITLQGASDVTDVLNGTCDDQTIIIDGRTTTGKTPIIQLDTVLGRTYRVTGITFGRATRTTINSHGAVQIEGNSHAVRIDHCHFRPTGGHSRSIEVNGAVWGVTDHCVIESSGAQSFNIQPRNWPYGDGTAATNGDGSWNSASNHSSGEFWFIEDNYIRNMSYAGNTAGVGGAALPWDEGNGNLDGRAGTRYVLRFNRLHDIQPSNHGTEGNRDRGSRILHIYNNHFTYSRTHGGGGTRSGTTIAHDNTFDGTLPGRDQEFKQDTYRTYSNERIWKLAGGANPWDSNDTTTGPFTEDGFSYSPTAGVYETGVATGGSLGSLVNTGKAWPINKWRGFVAQRDVSEVINGVTFNLGNLILSNTATTLTFVVYTVQANPTWTNGDAYKIRRPLLCIDQNGRGIGDKISGVTPINRDRGDVALWPRNALDPCYHWNNKFTGNINVMKPSFNDISAVVQMNREIFAEVMPFDGTTGVGYGLLSARPATCAVGVGYWATDQGAWRDDHIGNDGQLYVCDTVNHWTLHHTPYDYPHPLVGNTVTQNITSLNAASFTEGVGGTFQASSSGFTVAPTWSEVGTLPVGTSLSSGGLLTVGSGSAAGSYPIVLTATNGGETDSQDFTLTITAAPTRVIALSGSLAFGDHDVGSTSNLTFTINNSGNSTLTVSGITLPTGFTADWTSGTIGPAASHVVAVTFAPIAATTYSGTVTVASDKTSGTNTISASGTGATRVIALTGSLAFGNVTTGQTATRQLTITNSGNRTLTISSINYPQGFSGDLTSTTILAGANKTVNVTFSPTAVQAYTGTITVTSNKTSGTNTTSVSGTGVATATKIVQLTGTLVFGEVQTGTSVVRVLTITNGGNSTLTVSGITYPTGFTGAYAGTIAAGASQNVNVTFAPVSGTVYSGDITVASDATGGTDTIAASGTGVVPSTKIVGLSGSLAFGNVVLAATGTRTLTIANTGSAPLTVTSITYPTGFTGAYSGTIAPGATQNVTVTFAPTLVQSYGGTVTVASDATSGTGTTTCSGAGVVAINRVIVLTGDLTYGNVQKNRSVQRIFTISNAGTTTLTVSNITAPTGFTPNITSAVITPGASQDVTLVFEPTAQQSYGGLVTVISNKTSGVNTIACSGTGTNRRQAPMFILVQ